MDIRGLILVDSGAANMLPFTPTPLCMVDVAGASPLERVAERLRQFGISQITIVVDDAAFGNHSLLPQGAACLAAAPGRFWRQAESAFTDLAQKAEIVLLVRLGAYAEIDFERLVHFHLQGHRKVTQGVWGEERLEVFCLSASRRNDAASLFRSRLGQCRSECEIFAHRGYVNRLSGHHDLRQFGIDVLTMRTETRPAGLEIKPGIWAAPGASIEKGSRILPPAFIGSAARIRCGAVITRCTSVEHHAQVDCGTVVENSTVLPHVYLGAGLDLAHSVAGAGQIANLRRSVIVDVADEKLLGQVAVTRGQKLLDFAARLPATLRNGLFGEGAARQAPKDGSLPRPVLVPGVSGSSGKTADQFAANLTVARRYGDQ